MCINSCVVQTLMSSASKRGVWPTTIKKWYICSSHNINLNNRYSTFWFGRETSWVHFFEWKCSNKKLNLDLMRNPAEDAVFQIVNWLQIQAENKFSFMVSPRWNVWQFWSLVPVRFSQMLTLCKRYSQIASWHESKLQFTLNLLFLVMSWQSFYQISWVYVALLAIRFRYIKWQHIKNLNRP